MQHTSHPWGEPVWSFPIPVTPYPLTDGLHVDVAVVGAGFTGLATAHYVRQHCPDLHVAVFEAHQVGAGVLYQLQPGLALRTDRAVDGGRVVEGGLVG